MNYNYHNPYLNNNYAMPNFNYGQMPNYNQMPNGMQNQQPQQQQMVQPNQQQMNNQPINNNQMPMQNNMAMQQIMNSPIPTFAYVNGFDDAQKHIVMPNNIVYLQDRNSNCLYIKKADSQGLYEIKSYELKEINQEKPNDYVKLSDFDTLRADVNNLSLAIQNLVKTSENGFKNQNRNNSNNNKGENK